MRFIPFIKVSVTLFLLLFSIPSISQDKGLPEDARSLLIQGSRQIEKGLYEKAISYFKKANLIIKEELGEFSTDLGNSLNNIAICYENLDDFTKAIEYHTQALNIRKGVDLETHPDYAIFSLQKIGMCYSMLGKNELALNYDLEALELGEKYYNDSMLISLLDRVAEDYCSLNSYENALEYYTRSLDITKICNGTDDYDYAISIDNVASCYSSLGDYVNALEYYQLAFDFYKKIEDKNHSDYASCLNNIGLCYFLLGEYPEALSYFQQLLAIGEVEGKQTLSYASCLNYNGICYEHLGDYSKAIECHQQALEIREKSLGKEHPDYAASLVNISNCYSSLGDYTTAIKNLSQAMAIYEREYGTDSPDYASCLNNIGGCYSSLGYYSKALEIHQQALAIYENKYGKEHPDCASSLINIALCYDDLGDLSKAVKYSQVALEILEKTLGNNHPDYASCLNNLGLLYDDLGDYAKALECHQQALSIYEGVFGKEHPDFAMSLDNIGSSYTSLGDDARALEFFQRALEIREKTLGKEHADYASSLNNIGLLYYDQGDYDKALECYLQALAAFKKVYGNDHPNVATILNNVGKCYDALDDDDRALDYFLQALSIREKALGKYHPDYASSLVRIGQYHSLSGEHAKALNYYQEALTILENTLGKNHPQYASTLINIGDCYGALGDYLNASEYFCSFSDIETSNLIGSFASMTETQRSMFWEKNSFFYTDLLYYLSCVFSTSKILITAYNGALFGKGLLLNAETEMRKLILESGDGDALRMYNEIQESRVKLDRLYANPVGKKETIDSLYNDIEKRQQELMRRSKVFGDYTRNLALKWTDVQSALGKKDIAIEFETYTHQDTTFYIALTLRPGYSEPHLVELFNSKELDKLKPMDYDKTPFSNRIYQSPRMTELVWGDLADELNGVKNVYFSPAGDLNNIGIEYLLDGDGKHLLSEKRNYYRLTSTRELVKERMPVVISDATVYGGIKYDITPSSKLTGTETESEKLAHAAIRSYIPLDSLALTRGGSVWEYLGGSEKEAQAISSTLTSIGVHNDLFMGEAGTEESFKALSGTKKDVVHIATHGFYWTATEADRRKENTSSFMMSDESSAPKEDKALTRSGLLFAGAQNTFDGKDIPIDVEDGILTAKDISRLDLRETDLVVLSACQSGLGEVSGEGVFGLQRGFKKAGVQSIVMSLWEVSDEATKIMMTRFYENLANGRSKYDSFREAQEYLRKYKDGDGDTIFNYPEYYAAFVLLDAIN